MVASAPALWAGAWETASSGLDECPVREAFLTAQSPHPLDPSPSVRGLGRPRSPPSRTARARAGLQRRAFPGRGAGNPRMTGSGTAPSSARTSASRAGTFLGAAGRPRCLETHTLQDLPHCELSVVTGWVLRYSDLSFQCPCELRWGSKSRAWGLPGLAAAASAPGSGRQALALPPPPLGVLPRRSLAFFLPLFLAHQYLALPLPLHLSSRLPSVLFLHLPLRSVTFARRFSPFSPGFYHFPQTNSSLKPEEDGNGPEAITLAPLRTGCLLLSQQPLLQLPAPRLFNP